MDTTEIIAQAKRIIKHAQETSRPGSHGNLTGSLSEACDFLRQFAGEKSAFFKTLSALSLSASDGYVLQQVKNNLEGFIRFTENGLLGAVSIERRAQLGVVSDFLSQAQFLLESKDVHPAAPAVIVGASLEEFLRTWVEEENLSIGNRKPSIDSYATTLREAELITKQDMKEITAWAGIRNHAAHGEWDDVGDKQRIVIMLEGVSLFMRRYGLE